MYSLGKEVYTFVKSSRRITKARGIRIRQGSGFHARTFPELIERIAELSFRNPEYVLFYRGQSLDYRNSRGSSTFYPEIFRPEDKHRLPKRVSKQRFQSLSKLEKSLCEKYTFPGKSRIKKFQIIRWALLQHYKVCATPLLDVTQSLRVACTFAQHKAKRYGFVYAFAFFVTASSEEGLQIIRLLSICPPSALRPYFQEGYLLGEYPTITLDASTNYDRKELDFSRRLLCKFKIPTDSSFWPKHFDPIPMNALFPDSRDPLVTMVSTLGTQ